MGQVSPVMSVESVVVVVVESPVGRTGTTPEAEVVVMTGDEGWEELDVLAEVDGEDLVLVMVVIWVAVDGVEEVMVRVRVFVMTTTSDGLITQPTDAHT